jgi:hypothetical protein
MTAKAALDEDAGDPVVRGDRSLVTVAYVPGEPVVQRIGRRRTPETFVPCRPVHRPGLFARRQLCHVDPTGGCREDAPFGSAAR